MKRTNKIVSERINIMEVCGTHTNEIAKKGIRHLFSPKIKLLSGPGCPICVTDVDYIDTLIKLLENKEVIIATFGDMLKVKGNLGNLWENRSYGRNNVTVIYSPEDVITLALNNKDKNIVFAAVGFATTAPMIALTVKKAKILCIENLFLITSLKRMEPILRLILNDKDSCIDGMLCPGHVATVTGATSFRFISEEYGIPAVVCGFEAEDIITGICLLAEQIVGNKPLKFFNLYKRCVREEGNIKALKIIQEVFCISDTVWRGIGLIKDSSLKLKEDYKIFDAKERFNIKSHFQENLECQCTDILLGKKAPKSCKSFGKECTPDNPLGPCMVTSEGACASYFKYGG